MPMLFFPSRMQSIPKQSILRWFFVGFLSFSMSFFVVLPPLLIYCHDTFAELKIKEISQQMNFGVSQLDSTVSGVLNASQSTADDNRFLKLHHVTIDYSQISVSSRMEMRSILDSLIRPHGMVTDCTLQISDNNAVTPLLTTFGNPMGYYPFYFSADDLSYDEWFSLLSESSPGFLPVHRITTPYSSYDALIYSVRWNRDKYLYATINVNTIKKAMIDSEYMGDIFMTIENTQGDCLYTDCPDDQSNFHTVSQRTTYGNLPVSIHIPNTLLRSHMTPLYVFISIYVAVCVLILFAVTCLGSHVYAKPLIRIIERIESTATQSTSLPQRKWLKGSPSLSYGFDYIYSKIQLYEEDIQGYQTTIATQAKVLQARFMEKALHGTLSVDADYETFFFHFPQFPKHFCLILIGLVEQSMDNAETCPNALSLIQYQLQQSLPDAYQQQLSDTDMLLIINANNQNDSFQIVNRLITDINKAEPAYHVWGIMSKTYDHPNKIAFAYRQVQDLKGQLSTERLSEMCVSSDVKIPQKNTFQMSDVTAIYSAIVAGNSDVACSRYENYAELLNARNRSVCEMFRALLLCIKQEYANLLIDIEIPLYNTRRDMYTSLKNVIKAFCDHISTEKEPSDSFGLVVKAYIDDHFTEDTLCSTSLEEYFQCSYTKIRKCFSASVGISISSYIERKRMVLSNELLVTGEYSIAEVARKCGYVNDSTFYKAYKRTYGYPPSSTKKE